MNRASDVRERGELVKRLRAEQSNEESKIQ